MLREMERPRLQTLPCKIWYNAWYRGLSEGFLLLFMRSKLGPRPTNITLTHKYSMTMLVSNIFPLPTLAIHARSQHWNKMCTSFHILLQWRFFPSNLNDVAVHWDNACSVLLIAPNPHKMLRKQTVSVNPGWSCRVAIVCCLGVTVLPVLPLGVGSADQDNASHRHSPLTALQHVRILRVVTPAQFRFKWGIYCPLNYHLLHLQHYKLQNAN